MHESVDELASRGKQLPREDRERLVDQLLESLNEPAAAELDAAWAAEIDRRLAAYDRGEVIALSAEDVFAKARGDAAPVSASGGSGIAALSGVLLAHPKRRRHSVSGRCGGGHPARHTPSARWIPIARRNPQRLGERVSGFIGSRRPIYSW